MSKSMLHPNQVILGAVQLGICSEINDANPYEPEDDKRQLGWKQGHSRVIEEHQQYQRWDKASWLRKILCKVGFHKYHLKRIPGRPHIDPKTSNIDRRDLIIEKYICICGDIYFSGLSGQE